MQFSARSLKMRQNAGMERVAEERAGDRSRNDSRSLESSEQLRPEARGTPGTGFGSDRAIAVAYLR